MKKGTLFHVVVNKIQNLQVRAAERSTATEEAGMERVTLAEGSNFNAEQAVQDAVKAVGRLMVQAKNITLASRFEGASGGLCVS